MQKILYFFMLIGMVSCGQAPVSQNSKTDTLKSAKQKSPENNLKQQILGVWTSNVDGLNVVLEIKSDSIYYVEHDASYKYTLTHDSIKIEYPDEYVFKARISFNKDTLLMDSPDAGISKFWKFKD